MIWTPEKASAHNKKWCAEHKERRTASKIKWAKANPEKVKTSWDLCNKKHPEKQTMYKRNFNRKKRETPQGRLHDNISRLVNHSLHGRKAGRKWEELVGFSIEQLRDHIEKQFSVGMTWDNYGEWHLDHKTPRAVFNYEKPEDIDFKKCWALNNLQPLWKYDNLVKHDKLIKPFQPSLAFRG